MAQTLEKLFLTKMASMPKEEMEIQQPLKEQKPSTGKKLLPGAGGSRHATNTLRVSVFLFNQLF